MVRERGQGSKGSVKMGSTPAQAAGNIIEIADRRHDKMPPGGAGEDGPTLQLDLFASENGGGSALNRELERRRQDRREAELTAGMTEADALLAPLVLALARLAAQRDVQDQRS